MALVVKKFQVKTTEADGGSVSRDLAGRPQPGDPLYQNGSITESEHIQGLKSSGIPQSTLNKIWSRKVNVYDSYANALAFGAAGLIANMETVDRLTNLPTGDVIVQAAPTDFHQSPAGQVGVDVDANGEVVVAVEDGGGPLTVYYTSIGGRQDGPTELVVTA